MYMYRQNMIDIVLVDHWISFRIDLNVTRLVDLSFLYTLFILNFRLKFRSSRLSRIIYLDLRLLFVVEFQLLFMMLWYESRKMKLVSLLWWHLLYVFWGCSCALSSKNVLTHHLSRINISFIDETDVLSEAFNDFILMFFSIVNSNLLVTLTNILYLRLLVSYNEWIVIVTSSLKGTKRAVQLKVFNLILSSLISYKIWWTNHSIKLLIADLSRLWSSMFALSTCSRERIVLLLS